MQTQIKVRGYHLDVYQHVNNARYLEFLEEARWDGLENSPAFQWMMEKNIAFVVVNININYRRPRVEGRHRFLKNHCQLVTAQIGHLSGFQPQQIAVREADLAAVDARRLRRQEAHQRHGGDAFAAAGIARTCTDSR